MPIVTPTPITALPAAPQPTDTAAEFDSKSFSLIGALPDFVTDTNLIATQTQTNAQASKDSAQDAADSAASAITFSGFKGVWSGLTGPLAMPATVLHNNAYWVLSEPTADVTLDEPGYSAKWTPQILEARPIGAANLNALANSGSYSVASPTNGPIGVVNAVVNVTRAGVIMLQELTDSDTGAQWNRTAKDLYTVPVYSAWGRVVQSNSPAVALAGGPMDCSKGEYFTETISANRTLAFTNVPAGAYACILEVSHTGGVITQPGDAVYVAAAAPSLLTPKRHLFYYQKSMTGSGGWIVSTLPNSAP